MGHPKAKSLILEDRVLILLCPKNPISVNSLLNSIKVVREVSRMPIRSVANVIVRTASCSAAPAERMLCEYSGWYMSS